MADLCPRCGNSGYGCYECTPMDDTTHEAPDRIKVWPTYDSDTNDWSSGFWTDTEETIGTTYVRADLVQAAVAAKLREAAKKCRQGDIIYADSAAEHILALITPDAQAALDRVKREAWAKGSDAGWLVGIASEQDRCAKVAEQRKGSGWDSAPPTHPYDKGYTAACDAIAAAIRKGGK